MSGEVIALDPARLAGLEGHLQGLSDGCRRRIGRIGDELAGTGLAAPGAVDLLERVATWCAAEHIDVAWRRAAIEAMDVTLPLTAIELTEPEVEAEAHRWGAVLERLLADEPPAWDAVDRVMGEVRRRLHSAEYAVALLRVVGPDLAGRLAMRIEDAVRGAFGAASAIPDEVAADYLAAQATAARLIDLGTSVPESAGGLDDDWLDRLLGLPPSTDDPAPGAGQRFDAEEAAVVVGGLGLGLRLASTAAKALKAGRAAPVLGVAGNVVGLVGHGLDAADRVEDDPLCAMGQLGFGIASAGVGAASAVLAPELPLALAAMGTSFLFGRAAHWFGSAACGDDDEDEPPVETPPSNRSRSDAGDGGPPTYGGGGVDSPHQDGPGGPLPPNMVMGG